MLAVGGTCNRMLAAQSKRDRRRDICSSLIHQFMRRIARQKPRTICLEGKEVIIEMM